ncbi:MAG TPA: FAD-dependent oxidoreductase [Longimicrobiales bacterium]|nr:FAD-dependent oxidoreductase [Longimicrobiales bacterium]
MIVVVGGGLTGLALSRELDARGLEHVVLEAAARPGGIVRSGEIDGRILEWGPQRTRLTAGLRALASELGLEEQLIIAEPGLLPWVYARGRLRRLPTSPAALLTSDVLGPFARLRVALEPLTSGLRERETAGDYLIRKFGRAAYEDVLGPLYGGLYASRPTDMPARFALARALAEFGVDRSVLLWLLRRRGAALPPACSFTRGMQTLTDALAARAGDRLVLETPAGSVRRDRDGLIVATAEGPIRCTDVVLTVPAPVAGDLLSALDPDVAARLDGLAYNPLAIVHLLAEQDGASLRGLGYQVSFRMPLATRGVTWNDAMFRGAGRDGVYTAYLGGALSPETVELADDRLGALAAEEFEQVTGVAARPIAVARTHMPAWDHSWSLLDGVRFPEGVHACANWETRPGIPGRLAAARRMAARLARGGAPKNEEEAGGASGVAPAVADDRDDPAITV